MIIVLVIVALVVTGAAKGLTYMRKNNETVVQVASVGDLASDYYSPTTNLEANVTSSVSQNITVDKDMIIQQVYVNKGDSVSKGDKLVSFDMTLVEMELNIARLKKEKQEQDLAKSERRLKALKNGGALTEEDAGGSADNIDDSTDDSGDSDKDSLSGDDMAMAGQDNSLTDVGGNYLALAINPILLEAFTDAVGSGDDSEESDVQEDGSSVAADDVYDANESGQFGDQAGQDSSDNQFTSGEDNIYPITPEPTPTPVLDEEVDFVDGTTNPEEPDLTDGDEKFYQTLDYDTEPFVGSGTKDDPYVFLCSNAKGKVELTGGFLNRMAGYNEDGTEVLHKKGYWYLLEFHQNDTIADYTDRTQSCIGYYLVNGHKLKKTVDPSASLELTVEEASHYEPEEPEEPDIPGDGGSSSVNISRSDAIKLYKNRIATLKLDIQESEIKISQLEKKVNRQIIYSKLDGTVTTVGDPVTGTPEDDSSVFMSVKNKDGYYVVGKVGELLLDSVKEGTILQCTNYTYYDDGEESTSQFEAEVMDVSEYPVSSDSSYYYGDGNPNVSEYQFTAVIPDKSVKVRDGDYLNIQLTEETKAKGIVLSKAFVRSDNGNSYVYKDDKGVLKKQYLSIGGNVDNGYSVLITGGITRDDKIAFPYGKDVIEGAKTKTVSASTMYGEDDYSDNGGDFE